MMNNNCTNCNSNHNCSATSNNNTSNQQQQQQQSQQQQQVCNNANNNNNNVRSSYHQKALQQIRNSLQPFATVFSSSGSPTPAQTFASPPTSSTSSSPLPPPNNSNQQQQQQPPPPPPYMYYHALLQHNNVNSSTGSSPSPSTTGNNGLHHHVHHHPHHQLPPPPCDSPPPPPLPPLPTRQTDHSNLQYGPLNNAAAAAAAYYYQNNGYFTPLSCSSTNISAGQQQQQQNDSASTTSSDYNYYKTSSSGTLTPTTTNTTCSSRQSPSTNLLSSQLPPPPASRPGAIEFRAQQFPFVPSQVPMNVQQLLRRIDLSTTAPTNSSSPTRNNSPPGTAPSPVTTQSSRYVIQQQQPSRPLASNTPPLSSNNPSPTSQLPYKITTNNTTVSKKPTLIIKSTIVPKPVLQTATTVVDNNHHHQQQQRNNMTTNATRFNGSGPAAGVNSNNNSVNNNSVNNYHHVTPPPPPYNEKDLLRKPANVPLPSTSPPPPPLPPKPSKKPPPPPVVNGSSATQQGTTTMSPPQQQQQQSQQQPNEIIHTHESPIPERKKLSKEKEEERFESKVRVYSPAAFKFFMEQHVENVIKSHQERLHRRLQLESEMQKIGLSEEAQTQMRRMLSQKESNYIRLKRAKMDKSMFKVIRTIGVGAFGEVALVRKIDTQLLYAMKTLRKSDVLRRNQVAHVKAERDILAEADNEWVVKLYYSFQDKDHLYFVMDYIPGGDLMSLLIKKGIFEEPLAQFYIAELTCAIESVHKMGFIHRDIKPDNILIDRDGHIKLTDFGLCTGFRWTHNSKYYQENNCSYCSENNCNEHGMGNGSNKQASGNTSSGPKVLERRRMMMMRNGNKEVNLRCLAHSLVGTPNYIAPEVLLRTGYTQLCDWWSVGVILYEMLVGQPPFLAPTPAETQFKVINWEKTLRVPSNAGVSREARDLILKLCTDHSRRLGKNGAEQIKNHGFLYPIFHPGQQPAPPPDYSDALSTTSSISNATTTSYGSTATYSSSASSTCSSSTTSSSSTSSTPPINIRRTIAPYIPKIAHPTDTSNFDPCEEEATDHRLNFDDEWSNDNQFHGFFEFTFRRFFDDAYHLEDLAAAAAAAAAASSNGDGERGSAADRFGGKQRGGGGGDENNAGGNTANGTSAQSGPVYV